MADENSSATSSGAQGPSVQAAGAPAPTGAGAAQTQPQAQPHADWRAAITDEEARAEASRATDINGLARRVVDLRKQLSGAIVKPGERASEEQKAAYRRAIGVPETIDGYRFLDPPAGHTLTDAIRAERAVWAKAFHDANLPAETADRLIAKFAEKALAQQAAILAADRKYAADGKAALERKWGADAPINHTLGERALVTLADKAGVDVDALLNIETTAGTFLLDHPDIVQIFAAAGREMDEGSLGPASTSDHRTAIDGQLRAVRAGIERAQANRDSKEANRLYQQEQALIARMNGTRPIVGSDGRAA
jgi:hypothetical protein